MKQYKRTQQNKAWTMWIFLKMFCIKRRVDPTLNAKLFIVKQWPSSYYSLVYNDPQAMVSHMSVIVDDNKGKIPAVEMSLWQHPGGSSLTYTGCSTTGIGQTYHRLQLDTVESGFNTVFATIRTIYTHNLNIRMKCQLCFGITITQHTNLIPYDG